MERTVTSFDWRFFLGIISRLLCSTRTPLYSVCIYCVWRKKPLGLNFTIRSCTNGVYTSCVCVCSPAGPSKISHNALTCIYASQYFHIFPFVYLSPGGLGIIVRHNVPNTRTARAGRTIRTARTIRTIRTARTIRTVRRQ